MSDCNPRLTESCEREVISATTRGACPEWDVCLPFGASLHSEGGCVSYTPPANVPPDGEYDKIVVVNGCITGAKSGELPIYNESPCAPVPVPCDCEGGGSTPTPSVLAGNLYELDASGAPLVRVATRSGDGIKVSGTGTANDPIVVTNLREEASKQYFRGGDSVISVKGAGTADDPIEISHAKTTGGTYEGFTFDDYGHFAGYTTPSSAAVKGIIPGEGIAVDVDQGTKIATVSLATPMHPAQGTFSFGGYDVTLTGKNAIFEVVRRVNVPAATLAFGTYAVAISETGSIDGYTDTYDTGTEYVKYFGSEGVGESSRTGTFTLRTNSYLRISYQGIASSQAQANGIKLFLDGMPIASAFTRTFAATGGVGVDVEGVSSGVMASGQHTVTVQLTGSFGDAPSKLLVTATYPFAQ